MDTGWRSDAVRIVPASKMWITMGMDFVASILWGICPRIGGWGMVRIVL